MYLTHCEKYYENEIEKIQADKEETEKLKEAEEERVRKLETSLKLYEEEIQSLKNEKVAFLSQFIIRIDWKFQFQKCKKLYWTT